MKTIREDIKTQTFRHIYLLYGEEAYLLQQYKKDLIHALSPDADDMNFTRYEGKDVAVRELIDLCETMPFLSERRVILMENTGFFKNKSEELADYVTDMPDYLYLVFAEQQVDKRNRMYKAAKSQGRAVEFAPLKEDQLLLWISGLLQKNGRNISRRDATLLYSMTGSDMANLRNELEKLITYTNGRSLVTEKDIREICVSRTENRIFDMVRAVAERNLQLAMERYQELLTLKEPPMRILYLMSRQYRQLLQIRRLEAEGASSREIGQIVGIPSFAYRSTAACAASYTISELENALEDFASSEEAVKTGQLAENLVVELMIVKYSQKKKETVT